MTRLRIVFLAVAVVVLVPLLLLVRRALASAQAERDLERRAVADRVVDEMERELTAFLRREEDRPFSHYRHLAVPDDPAAGVALVRSPLADPLPEPFVVGPFQIAPDGSVTTPLWPDAAASADRVVAAVRDRFPLRPGLDLDEAETAAEPVRPAAKQKAGAKPSPRQVAEPKSPAGEEEATEIASAQRPGTTVDLGDETKEPAKEATEADAAASSSPLEILSQLNRAAEGRKLRYSKTEQTQVANVLEVYQPFPEPGAPPAGDDETEADAVDPTASNEQAIPAPSQQQESQADSPRSELPQAEPRRDAVDQLAVSEPAAVAPRGRFAHSNRRAGSVEPPPAPVVDVRVEPMVGRRLDEGTMVLYRTVLAGDRAFRQGLVLDVEALVRWLADRALADVGGDRSLVGVRVEPDPGDAVGDGAVFRHRFAEPFGPAAAIVTVDAAPGLGSVEVVELLTVLLFVAATLGLLALYRMVAVAVRYAERRSDFVSAVTHELKTPLTAIRMYGEMLRDGIVVDEARRQRYYETITAEGERLSRLVENVLELARLERREKPAALAVGDVGGVLKEALAVLAPHAEKQGFTFELEVEPGLPAARFDRDSLMQVVFNLIDNAIKYSRAADEKKVIVRARRDDGAVVVTVADRGPGVAPRHLRHLFEPFWRGESELTRTTKGTGIGLALVRGLVARMGGAVSARNGDGGGFEVRVRLAAA